jgi:hypothetical protein
MAAGRNFPDDGLPGSRLRISGLKDTVFTVWLQRIRPSSLQSLLDTTPPKRVPVLWDGPAPAPSLGPNLTSALRT